MSGEGGALEIVTSEYHLFVIPVNEMVRHAKKFTHKSEAIMAFNALVNDGKMRAVFLDEKTVSENKTHSSINIKKWRKRNGIKCNKTFGKKE